MKLDKILTILNVKFYSQEKAENINLESITNVTVNSNRKTLEDNECECPTKFIIEMLFRWHYLVVKFRIFCIKFLVFYQNEESLKLNVSFVLYITVYLVLKKYTVHQQPHSKYLLNHQSNEGAYKVEIKSVQYDLC